MRVLLTGSSGLVGSALVAVLTAAGHEVVRLVRPAAFATVEASLATWNPATGEIDLSRAGSLDAVVHLAGEPIARRWTPEVKKRVRSSRVDGTRLLAEALARLPVPPKVLICASATGFYGDRGDEWLDEQSACGGGFLAEVCQEWEAAASPARERGLRVAHLRIGLALTPKGGALAKMLPAFRLGFGGKLGDGGAYWSWITVDDLLSLIQRALTDEAMHGPVNAVTPHPVTNAEFTQTLGRVLRRPAILPVPRFALEAFFGEMGREALLASFRVKPAKLMDAGFKFRFAELEPALRHLLAGAPAN
jgi:hypothetical protein